MFFASTHPASLRRAAYVPAMRSLDRLLDQALAAPCRRANACRAEVRTDDAGWTLSLDVPGVSREELNIGIEGQVVRIETLADAPRNYRQAFELPQDIDAATSVAKLENGVLTLTLAKKQPMETSTRLTIN
ncbi:MAG: Hsp20/alpha crystallin family protein [Comamonadaceae bacterium]|uniref:Hsp20/alpha crystallin family protein n=1 Tax=Candidatus Skiveiella danica TaxID=3386177 RepID=UPI00390A5890|nr:Hsp20/alpha crystallin family protein [Comamonadaceae bacterium]